MTVLEDLVVKLSADVNNLTTGMKQASDSVDKASASMTSSLKRTESESSGIFGNIRNMVLGVFGGNILTGMVSKFTGGMKEAFASAMQFERGVAQINAVLPQNEKMTKASISALKDLSTTYGTEATVQAKAYYDIVTSGIQGTANQMEVLTAANETAIGGMVSLSDSVGILTTYLQAYSKEGYNATKISDTLFKAAQSGGTSFSKMAEAAKGLIPYTKSANISLEEMTTTLAFMTKQGQSAETSTAQLQMIIKNIINPTKMATEYANHLGISFNAQALQAKGLTGVLSDVVKATGGSTEAMNLLFPRMQAVNGVVALAKGGFDNLTKAMKDNKDSAGATAKAAEEVKKSTDFKLNQTITDLKNLGMELAMDCLPAIRKLIELFKDGVVWAKNFTDGILKITGTLKENTETIHGNTEKIKEVKGELEEWEQKAKQAGDSNIMAFVAGGFSVDNIKNKIASLKLELSGLESQSKKNQFAFEKMIPESVNKLLPDMFKVQAPIEIPLKPVIEKETPIAIPLKSPEMEKAEKEEAEKKAAARKAAHEKSLADQKAADAEAFVKRKDRLKALQDLETSRIAMEEESNKNEQDNLDNTFDLELISQSEYLKKKQDLIDESWGITDDKLDAQHDADLAKLKESHEQHLITLSEFNDQKILIEEAYDKRSKANLIHAQDEERKMRLKAAAQELKDKETTFEHERILITGFQTFASALLKSGSKEAFLVNQAAALANAIVNMYEGVSKGVALGVPLGPPAVTWAYIQGGLSIAGILAQSIKGFQYGITEIPPGYRGDKYPAMLSSGERVVDADTNTDLKNFLGGGGGSSRVEIAFKGDAMELLEMQLTDRMDKGISRLRIPQGNLT
jgi:TP901 family phage tail tape measure protein